MQGKGQKVRLSLHTRTFWRLTRTQGRPGCFPQLSGPDHPLPGPCVWTRSPLVSPSSALLGLFKMQIRPISTLCSQAWGLQGQKPESPVPPLCPGSCHLALPPSLSLPGAPPAHLCGPPLPRGCPQRRAAQCHPSRAHGGSSGNTLCPLPCSVGPCGREPAGVAPQN